MIAPRITSLCPLSHPLLPTLPTTNIGVSRFVYPPLSWCGNMNLLCTRSYNASFIGHQHPMGIPTFPAPYPCPWLSYHDDNLFTPVLNIEEFTCEVCSLLQCCRRCGSVIDPDLPPVVHTSSRISPSATLRSLFWSSHAPSSLMMLSLSLPAHHHPTVPCNVVGFF